MEQEGSVVQKKEIKISEILEHFRKGVERYKVNDTGYGSIEELYSLNSAECRVLFNHAQIKGRKVVNQITKNKRNRKN